MIKNEEDIINSNEEAIIDSNEEDILNKEEKNNKFLIKNVFFCSFLTFLLLFNFINIFVVSRGVVSGESMYPTLNNEESILINKFSYYFNEPNYNDIIVFNSHNSEDDFFVKRIIGLPGDTVEIIDGKLFINDRLIEEHYLKTDYVSTFEKMTNRNFTSDFSLKVHVYDNSLKYTSSLSIEELNNLNVKDSLILIPEDFYFVLGDNRPHSLDSREIGLVSRDSIEGKLINF